MLEFLHSGTGKMRTVQLLSAIAFIAMCLSCSSNHFNPYKPKGKTPSPLYNGRVENRLYSEDRYTSPPAVTIEKNQLTQNKPEDASVEVIPATLEFTDKATYMLGPGDVVEVIYQLKAEPSSDEYKLSIQDKIKVEFFYTPKFNSEETVRVDGKISLPLIGDVMVRNLTTTEVEKELLRKYRDILKDPVIKVSVVNSNWAIEELKRAITTAPRGQSRLEPVRPDGFISLPLIGDVLVAGMNIPKASDAIIEKYRKIGVPNVDVTIVLLEAKSAVAYVTGEVLTPGPIVVMERDDVWRTISKVGGFSQLADRNHVVVIKSGLDGEKRLVLDFEKWKNSLDTAQNSLVRRSDIIYVPKKKDTYVYLVGAVEKPGRVELDSQTAMTASQAIAMGGKINAGANERQALVLRRTPQYDPIIIQVDLKDIFNKRNYNQKDDHHPRDPYLEPGDIIYVPNAFIGDVDRFAESYFKDGIWTIIPFGVSASYTIE